MDEVFGSVVDDVTLFRFFSNTLAVSLTLEFDRFPQTAAARAEAAGLKNQLHDLRTRFDDESARLREEVEVSRTRFTAAASKVRSASGCDTKLRLGPLPRNLNSLPFGRGICHISRVDQPREL